MAANAPHKCGREKNMKKSLMIPAFVAAVVFAGGIAHADTVKVPVNKVTAEGIGNEIGAVTFVDTPEGVDIIVDLAGLSAGEHGMHVHQNPSCAPAAGKDGKMGAALAAGGHFDPDNAGVHAGPGKKGHKGDLPFITADAQGNAKEKLSAPGISTKDISKRALMIHAGGDNYSDNPPLGGGGGRIACGVIK